VCVCVCVCVCELKNEASPPYELMPTFPGTIPGTMYMDWMNYLN
jgi:hypothetical protein